MYAISASRAPRTSAPFSEGTSAGRYVFVSAQPPADPKTGALVKGSLKEMAARMGVSYPSVRNRLDEIIGELRRAVAADMSDE